MTSIGAQSGYSTCTQESLSVTGGPATNRINSAGFLYDSSGNMTTDGINTYAWNAESELKSAAGVNYTYDGDGNRVQKSNGKIYWYGAGSEVLDESDASGNITDEYVYFGGKRIAHRAIAGGVSTYYYYVEDSLGSSRVMTAATGRTVCYDADFLPFGQERVIVNNCAQNYKFSGKERDTETGNDDFGARSYSSSIGRWLSADWSAIPAPVPYANLTNPQTLNLYAMVSDNPETFADLDGHYLSLLQADGMLPGDDKQPPPPPPPPPPQADTSHADSEKIAERLVMAGEALVNMEMANVKLQASAVLTAAAPETGGATAVPAALLAISASGNMAAAGIQTAGAITGQTRAAGLAEKATTAVTSPTGLITLVATGGNIQQAARNAAIEGVVTANPNELFHGSLVQAAAKLIDFTKSVIDAF